MDQLAGRIVYVVLGAIAASWVLSVLDRHRPSADIGRTISMLKVRGWVEARLANGVPESTAEDLEDLPVQPEPIAGGTVVVEYGPRWGEAEFRGEEGEGQSRLQFGDVAFAGETEPCALDGWWELRPEDLAGRCRFDIVEVGGTPMGLVALELRARTPHGEVVRTPPPEERRIEDLWVARDVVRRGWEVDALLGASTLPGVAIGMEWRRSGRRLGYYAIGEIGGGEWTASGGVRVRIWPRR